MLLTKIKPPAFAVSCIARSAKTLATLSTLLAAAVSLHAEHFYPAFVQEYDRTNLNQGQTASAVAVDSRGNVIVTGNAPSAGGSSEWYTAKYDALDGHLLWSRRLGVSTPNIGSQGTPIGDCYAKSVAIDSQDNVIVTGGANFVSGQQEDVETVKYSPDGTLVWSRGFNGGGGDEGKQVVVGPGDAVYVGATVFNTNGQQENFQALYYSSAGTLNHSPSYARTVSNIHCSDKCTGIAVTDGGEVWLTGSSTISGAISFLTVKFDATGALAFAPKVYTSPGAFGGATGIAIDSGNNVFVTGKYTDGAGNHGFYTVKYISTGIPFWEDIYTSGNSDHAGGAQSIAIGPDNNPVITGALEATNGTTEAVTIKYRGAGASVERKWVKEDIGLSPLNDQNLPEQDTVTHKVFVDAANQVLIIGESSPDNTTNPLMYLAKYRDTDGATLYGASYSGDGIGNNTGVAITSDQAGNIVFAGTEARMKTQSVSLNGIATVKLGRILETGDPLPPNPDTQAARTVSVLNAPALADNGGVAVRISFKEGKKTYGGILTELGAGGVTLPVVQGDLATDVMNAKFASFGEPVVSQDRHYAFPAKLSGVPGSSASTVWTNLGGTLHLALRQGSTYAGLKLASVSSISLHDTQLVALVKATGGVTALLGLDAGNNATVLLKTGTPVTVPGTMITSNIKTITTLSPAVASPGDGRWQGVDFTLARATLANGTQLVYRITTTGTPTAMLYSGQAAPMSVATGATWKSFGLPAIAPSGANARYAALGTLNKTTGVTTANDEAIVYSLDGTTFAKVAAEGGAADTAGLIGLSYLKLSDPLINSATKVAFVTTLKATPGSGAKVSAKDNHALIYGTPGALQAYVRTGASARDSQGNPIPDAVYSAIKTFGLSAGLTGVPSSPFFVATLSGKAVSAKTNTGLWGIDSTGKVRLLLRTGQVLGAQTVKSFTLLKATPQAFAAERSINANSSVAILVSFTDRSTGILELAVP